VVSRLVSVLDDDEAVTIFLRHCLEILNSSFAGSSGSVECYDEDLFPAILDAIKVYLKEPLYLCCTVCLTVHENS